MAAVCISGYKAVFAAVPTTGLGFQGQLFDAGTPVTASVSASFAFYDALTGGSLQGSAISQTISVSNGYFSTTFSEADLAGIDFNQSLWLQVTVEGNALTPRSPVNSVPFANRAFGVFSFSSAPAVGPSGALYYNSASSTLMVSNGSSWATVATTSSVSSATTTINGASGPTFTFATGSSGTDFAIATSTGTVTFNIPTASASNRGLLSSSDFLRIPSAASSTEWAGFFATPSSRITAGNNLAWTGNSLGFSGILPIANGGTGTSTAPTLGALLMGNASGGYDLVATSSLGIAAGTNYLVLGSGYLATATSTDAIRAAYFVSTSTTATSTLAGGFTVGTSNFVVTQAGDVGIGAISPYAKLSVTNTGTGPSFLVEDTTSSDATPFIIDSIGNVGVGTSTTAAYKLAVDGDVGIANGYLQLRNGTEINSYSRGIYIAPSIFSGKHIIRGYNNAGGGLQLESYNTGTGTSTVSFFMDPSNRFLQFNTSTSTSVAAIERMRLDGNGNLGIGTTAPGKKLEINLGTADALRLTYNDADGSAAVYMDTTVSSVGLTTFTTIGASSAFDMTTDRVGTGYLQINNTNAGNASAALIATTAGTGDAYSRYTIPATSWSTGIDNSASDSFMISNSTGPGTNDYLTITTAGNVGIGTSSPSSVLEVNGASKFRDVSLFADGLVGAPGIGFINDPTTGLYRTASGVTRYTSAGTGSIIFQGNGVMNLIGNNAALFMGASSDVVLRRNGASSIVIGMANSATPAANTLTIGETSRSGTDSNVAGSNGTINSGTGTGDATGSSLIFQTPTPTSSGTGAQTLASRLTLNSVAASFTGNVGIGTTTPAFKLDVSGDMGITSAGIFYKNGERFIHTSGGGGGGGINENTFIGYRAANVFSGTGYANTIIGKEAGLLLNGTAPNGSSNTVVGYQAFNNATTASFNTMFGTAVGQGVTTEQFNTFIGYHTGLNATGGNSTALGTFALSANTASDTVAIGYKALEINTSGIQNTAVGALTLSFNITSAKNTAVGFNALLNTVGTTGTGENTAVGDQAGKSNTTGYVNTFVGADAGRLNTTGLGNTFLGRYSGRTNVSGQNNTYVGRSAGENSTGSGNVSVGYLAGAYETGSNAFYVNNINQVNTAGDKAYSLLYGTFSGTAGSLAGQQLVINGNVGIGTTTPSASFFIQGRGGVDPFAIASSTGAAMLTLLQNGNLGIGTSTPGSRIALAGGSFVHTAYGNPSILGTYDTAGDAYDVHVLGRYAYVADGTSGVHILDISNPASPILLATYSSIGTARDIRVSGRYAYVAYGSTGLVILDVSNPAAPSLAGSYDTSGEASGVHVSGRYAYVADASSGLHVIDISNPAAPSLAGTYNTSGSAQGLYVSGKYAYVADSTAGLQVIDVSNPAAPALAGTYNTSGSALGAYVSGRYAYVADNTSGLHVIDISSSSAPALVGTYNTTGDAYDVHVSGRYAYVAGLSSGLHVLDVSSSSAPALVGTYDTAGVALGIFVSGKRAYVADATSGLAIVDLDGTETPALLAGSVEAGGLIATEDVSAGGDIFAQGGLHVGMSGIFSRGTISSYVSSSTAANPVAANFMGGSVGIGTTTPSASLHIQGRGGVNPFAIASSTGTAMLTLLQNGNLGIGTSTPTVGLVVVGNGQFTGVTSGAYASDLNLTADGILTTSASDIRLKENIREIATSTMPNLMALKTYTFNWKTDSTHRTDIGLIAQEVEEIFPELVFTNATDGFKGVNYSRLSIFLVKGLQEQQIQIDQLRQYATFLRTKELHTEKLCLGDETDEVCITKGQLESILSNSNIQPAATPVPAPVVDPMPDPAPGVDPAPDPAPVSDPDSAPAPVSETGDAGGSAADTGAAPGDSPSADPIPVLDPVPEPAPAPAPDPTPAPAPASEPQPAPAPAADPGGSSDAPAL